MKYCRNTFWLSILLIALLFIITCSIIVCFPDQYAPEDGIWYCEELLIQLSYEPESPCFIIENNQEIVCACGSDRGSDRINIFCQDAGQSEYHMGELVFSAQVISLNDIELVVFDENTNQQYIFRKIN